MAKARQRYGSCGFSPPDEAERLSAIGISRNKTSILHRDIYHGSDVKITPELYKAILPDEDFFKPKKAPGRHDWLASQEEIGQTFKEYADSNYNKPGKLKHVIYIVPLTFFESTVPEDIQQDMAEFASIFFNMKVSILKPKSLAGKIDHRKNDGQDQVNATQILQSMKGILPRDAFCMGGITLCDLYPRDSWNFVFGIADLKQRVGVYSLARHMPEDVNVQSLSRKESGDLLRRACSLMCHEMCHMFGMQHCIYFECIMNGSMHYQESDSKPIYLCPVCLRKLHVVCKFNPVERYSKLREFTQSHGMDAQTAWYTKRLEKIQE